MLRRPNEFAGSKRPDMGRFSAELLHELLHDDWTIGRLILFVGSGCRLGRAMWASKCTGNRAARTAMA